MQKMKEFLNAKFGLEKRGTNVKTEIMAGITTFIAMVYVLMVNANMFSETGEVSYGAMYIVTAISAVIGTLLVGLFSGLPLAQAPGIGLAAFFVYTVCLGFGFSYANALVLVWAAGVVSILLTVTGLRKKLLEAVPESIKKAIPAGIGLFIAFLGFKNAGLVVVDATTGVAKGSMNILAANGWANAMPLFVALFGLILIAVMQKKGAKGAILFGILGATALYYLLGLTIPGFYQGVEYTEYYVWDVVNGNWVLNVEASGVANNYFLGYTVADTLTVDGVSQIVRYMPAKLSLDILQPFQEFSTQAFGKVFTEGFDFSAYIEANGKGSLALVLATSLLAFVLLDMFDAFGTLYGACAKGDLLDEQGNVPHLDRAMLADAVATCCGAVLGTSTVMTFIESTSGVAVGGKTALTSCVTAILFALSVFLFPIAQLIPSAATAPALIFVGVLMMGGVREVDWGDPAVATSSFLTIVMMPFGYNISAGIGFGLISFVAIKAFTGKVKEVKPTTYVLALLFLLMFLLSQ